MKAMKRVIGKKRIAVMALCLALVLSGCGNSGGGSKEAAQGKQKDSVTSDEVKNADQAEQVTSDAETDAVEGDAEASTEATEGTAGENTITERQKVSKEMLIYRGNVMIETLDFTKSVEGFKKLLDQTNGFVETESYTDDGVQDAFYLVEDEEKHNTYTATVRVPSGEYDRMMNATNDFGDVRSKTSRADNVTQQYGTAQSELKIYETEYNRYMDLLEKAQEDEYALKIQDKMFDLQIKIADLKSSIANIETDVTYSYLDITIREVSKYQEEPASTDSFLDRLKNTCVESWSGFLGGLEGLLFFLIRAWYYLVILAGIAYLSMRFYKKRRHGNTVLETTMTEEKDFEGEEHGVNK